VFDHVTIRVSDRDASGRFYDTVLGVLGIESEYSDDDFTEWDDFSLTTASAWSPVTNGLPIGFGASSRERVDEFWELGTGAGYESDGEPGPRPEYGSDYYGGFLLDPDGNSVEAVNFEDVRHGVDHLWIRVRDVAASKRFYDTIAPHAGFRPGKDTPERAQFISEETGSFSVLSGDHLTENLHMAFPATTNEAVNAFHDAAIEAGYTDNGTPGERAEYHRGYYAAYVLDPDRNNIEVVNHNR
jgi:catechol 2,3-dioxygenase-like lactoylglutathione lyase family enzyme